MSNAPNRVWAIWTRTFGKFASEHTLHVLRFVIEGEDDFSEAAHSGAERSSVSNRTHIRAAAAVLQAAQREAALWGMMGVEVWNPSRTVEAAAREIFPALKITHREEESVTSLMWYGEEEGTGDGIAWVMNEKYAWC